MLGGTEPCFIPNDLKFLFFIFLISKVLVHPYLTAAKTSSGEERPCCLLMEK